MPDAGAPMVEARGLKKDYGETHAVREVSFRVARGEVVGLLGPNGAGKSTTMKMLTGYLKPTAGEAFIGGIAVAADPIAARRRLGYLPENAPLYDEMMVTDFLDFIARVRGVPAADRRKRIRSVAERCGLQDVLGKDIGQLSKGYRQRTGLAQAMLHDPDLLVLDEPTSGLDPNQIVEIRELIRDLGREKTVILSTHILPEAQATCSRILIISEGRLVADDTPEALTGERAQGTIVRLVVRAKSGGAPPDPKSVRGWLAAVPGVREVSDDAGEGPGSLGFTLRATGSDDPREAVFTAAVANGLVLIDLHRERVSLEETFRRLTHAGDGAKEGAAHV